MPAELSLPSLRQARLPLQECADDQPQLTGAPVHPHAPPPVQLIEKYVQKPFYDRWDYDNPLESEDGSKCVGKVHRMSENEVLEGLYWINDRFQIISNAANDFPTIDWILDKARSAVLR